MAKVESTFETLDESIAHSARHDPWFRASKTIVGVGSLLEIAAMTLYRREFRPNDPIVGPLLGTFTVLYLAAWMHVFYTMVKIRLSKATRILCVIFGIAMVIFLMILLVIKPVLESIRN